MQFIKENKFLIGVVAGTIVLSCVFLFLASDTASTVEASLLDREKVQNDLKGCETTKDPANERSVEINKAFVNGIKTQVNDSKQITIDWNKKRYWDQIMKLKPKEDTGLATVTVFPPDMQLFKNYQLWLYFRKEYNKRREEIIKALGTPAEEPTNTEVDARIPYFKKVVEYNDRLKAAETMPASGPVPTPAAPANPANAAKTPANSATPAGPTVDERARKLAMYEVRKKRAQTGDIYYSKDVADNLFPSLEDTSEIKLQDMQNAQYFLWVLNDLVEAIANTNKDALSSPQTLELLKKTGDKPCVMYSAIKRVEKISISFGHTAANPLTGRATNAEQTIVGYSIRLIMPMSKFSLFQANLLRLNYHTLTGVNAEAYTTPADALFDYGFEPVWIFTIEGEVLFKAAWERDLWKPVGTGTPTKK